MLRTYILQKAFADCLQKFRGFPKFNEIKFYRGLIFKILKFMAQDIKLKIGMKNKIAKIENCISVQYAEY